MHVNYFIGILADATAAPTNAPATTATPMQGLFGSPIILFVLMFVILYFLMIRPQQQQRKKQMKLLESLKSGDKVVTSSGIIGVVITVKDKSVSLRSADAKMEVTKASVAEVIESGGATES